MAVRWPDSVDEVFAGDQAVGLAYATAAKGAVVLPVTNFAVRDRDVGTITVNSSIGVSRKIERIRHDPHVALAFHTREHGYTDRPEYVLVQGKASLSEPIENYPDHVGPNWEKFDGPRPKGRLWDWWLKVYETRVSIDIAVERIVVWPNLTCAGEPEVYGAPLPEAAREQSAPTGGTAPRIDLRRAAHRVAGLPNQLLSWVGADRYPVVVPVRLDDTAPDGMVLNSASGLIPDGGRRAGLTAHWFSRWVNGQHQRIHTGWLTSDDGAAVYAPHTEKGHKVPASSLVFHLGVGFATRRGARRSGAA